MKIIVHGTIGGYKVFYKSENTPFSIARDARSASGKTDPLGQLAYSFIFDGRGCAFTKYIIVYDVQRGAIGFMAFTLYIANTEKLSGKYIKQFLDELTQQYSDNYIVDNRVDSIRVCRDWTFVEKLRSEYINQLEIISKEDIEIIEQGVAENGFVYYSSEDELIKYLDSPYEKEYEKYKQIFLVNEELKGKAINPLNSLSHNPENDLTGKIDIDNPKYRLIFSNVTKDGVSILVEENINGAWVKQNNNNRVRKNDTIRVTHQKSYYKSDSAEGVVGNFDPSFIGINDSKKAVVIKVKELLPEKRIITFELNKKELNDVEITVLPRSDYQKYTPKRIENNQVTFVAEEIGQQWIVSAKTKKKDFIAEALLFIPKDVNETITLVLEEHKVIKIIANDKEDGDLINDIDVRFYKRLITAPRRNEVTFVGEEVNRLWKITVSDSRKEYKSTNHEFTPKNEDRTVGVLLQKTKTHPLRDSGKGGESKHGEPTLPPNNKKPWYKKPKVFAFSVFALAVVAIVLFLVLKSDREGNPKPINNDKNLLVDARDYRDGVELDIDTLGDFKEKLKALEEKEKKRCVNKFLTSKTLKQIQEVISKLDEVIKLRETINKGSVEEFKGLTRYLSSSDQENIKNAIEKLKDQYYDEIGESLKNIDSNNMNLNEVADFIIDLQSVFTIGDIRDINDKSELEKKKNELKEKIADIDNSDSSSKLATIIDSLIEGIDAKIVALGGNDTAKEIHNKSSASSEFVTKFWSLVRKDVDVPQMNDYVELYNNIEKIKYSNGSKEEKTQLFLKNILGNSNDFEPYKKIGRMQRKEAGSIQELRNLME